MLTAELPEPLEWEIVRADKADRDSFYYVFPFDPALRQTLSSAVAFQLKDGTTLLFSGRVDGYTVSLSAAGGILKLYGRSTAALLMDYEFPAADYSKPTMKMIAQTYVGPVSVACYYDEPTTVPDTFHVSLGDSAMKVISNFAASVEALPCYDAHHLHPHGLRRDAGAGRHHFGKAARPAAGCRL